MGRRGEARSQKEAFQMSGYKVAVAGATGNVGREMLAILAERRFPVSEVVALASTRSIGKEVSFGDRTLKCKALDHYDFSDTDICLMSAGGAVSKEVSPRIGAKGCVVIDNSSAWRHGPGRAARRAGGQRRRGQGLRQQVHHRQPELLDHPDGRGAEAAARPRRRSSGSWSRPTSRSRARARRRWTNSSRRPGRSSSTIRSSRRSSPSTSPSTSFPRSTSSWTTARPRKNGRWWSRRRRSSIRRSS